MKVFRINAAPAFFIDVIAPSEQAAREYLDDNWHTLEDPEMTPCTSIGPVPAGYDQTTIRAIGGFEEDHEFLWEHPRKDN